MIVNLVNGQVHAEKSFPAPLTAVDFSPNSATLAIGTTEGTVSLVMTSDLAQLPPLLSAHAWLDLLTSVRSRRSPVGCRCQGRLVLVLDASGANEPIEPILLRGHTSAVLRVELSPDGQTLVSGGIDGTIKVWDLAHVNQSPILHGHETSLGGLAFNGDGDQLDSVDVSGVMRIWRLNDGEPLRMNQSQGVDVLTARVSQSGKSIAWIDPLTAAILIRDIATGRQVRLNWPDHEPTGLTLSPDDKLLAAVDLKNQRGLAIWNIASGRQLATLDDIQLPAKVGPFSTAFSPDTKQLAIAQDSGVLLWDWQAGKSRTILEIPGTQANVLAFSADGGLLAVAAVDTAQSGVATVRIWDLQANELLTECHIAGQKVAALAFSPDGRRLASGGTTSSQQGILNLWDTTGGREVLSEQFPMAMITTVAFSSDGRRLAAGVTPIEWSNVLKGQRSGERNSCVGRDSGGSGSSEITLFNIVSTYKDFCHENFTQNHWRHVGIVDRDMFRRGRAGGRFNNTRRCVAGI